MIDINLKISADIMIQWVGWIEFSFFCTYNIDIDITWQTADFDFTIVESDYYCMAIACNIIKIIILNSSINKIFV